jgi:hypothetical protein
MKYRVIDISNWTDTVEIVTDIYTSPPISSRRLITALRVSSISNWHRGRDRRTRNLACGLEIEGVCPYAGQVLRVSCSISDHRTTSEQSPFNQ